MIFETLYLLKTSENNVHSQWTQLLHALQPYVTVCYGKQSTVNRKYRDEK